MLYLVMVPGKTRSIAVGYVSWDGMSLEPGLATKGAGTAAGIGRKVSPPG